MRAWYDIRGLNLEDRQDVQGVKESQASIENLLAAEKARGFAAIKFSWPAFRKGAAMAVYTGLRHVETLAGVIALSGYLLFGDALAVRQRWQTGKRLFFRHTALMIRWCCRLGRNLVISN